MAKKKDFGVGGPPPRPVIPIFPSSTVLERSAVCTLTIPLPHGVDADFDWAEYLGRGFDDTVSAITQVMRAMVLEGKPKPLSLRSIASSVIRWFQFCTERAASGAPPTLNSIDGETIDAFAGWLSTRLKSDGEVWALNTARTSYSKVKTVLEALANRKLLPRQGLFSRNPFPGATDVNRRRNQIPPLSDGERERILRPLAMEVAEVFDGTHRGLPVTQFALCVFAILLKTGVNPTPFLEIPRDLQQCFMSHPRINRKVLVTFKRRAGKHTTTPLHHVESRVVSLDVYKLCERVVSLTEDTAKRAMGTKLEGLLWLYEVDGAPRGMSTATLSTVANSFTLRHNLVRDDGTRLKMSSQLFRNTKLNRIWRASKGDLLATARSASNTPTAAQRYLAVTPDMLDEHRLAGEVLVDTLSAAAPRDNTPHSGCSDAFNGEFAPKDGSACVDFLSCFRCKSQVIVQDDLYKLFSFYWALFSQRSHIGQDNWRNLFGWVTRVIDRDIAPKFDATVVEREKARARTEPHPMWRSPSVLAALRSIQ